jgi:cytochrome b561
MPMRNTATRWGAISQSLHWIIVALVITQFVLANSAASLPQGLEKLVVLARHKSVGITILGLAVLRLLWRWTQPVPALPPDTGRWERTLAHASHALLYALLFAIPLAGWMMSSARNFSVSWFNLVQLPDLVSPDRALYETLHTVHVTLARVLATLAILHALAALRHHFLLKDDVLRRMLPGFSARSATSLNKASRRDA